MITSDLDWSSIPIRSGEHLARGEGVCALEMVAWMAGEPHNDHPACVSKTIATFIRAWNDSLPSDDEREILRPVLPALIGTAGNMDEELLRSEMCMDWLLNEQLPSWLRLLPSMKQHGKMLESSDWRTSEGGKSVLIAELALKRLIEACPTWENARSPFRTTKTERAVRATGFTAGDLASFDAVYNGQASAFCTRLNLRTIVFDAAELAVSVVQLPNSVLNRTTRSLQQSALRLIDRMIQGGKDE